MLLALAACGDDTPTGTDPTPNPVAWTYGTVSLQAADFYLEADGVKYLANVPQVDVGGSGASSTTSKTLELEWVENGVDMRLYIYLSADSAHWWSHEIRTYDGATNDDGTRWIYYYGEFFKSPVGSSFVGDVDLTSNDSDNGVTGRLHFTGLHLSAF